MEIGIFEELKSLAMIGRSKIYKLKPLERFTSLPKKTDQTQDVKREKQGEEVKKKTENELTTERKLTGKGKFKENKSLNKGR